MRGILVDWMVEVAEEYKLQPETLFLSIHLVDRYLSETRSKDLARSRLQLVGVTAMLIASKYEEIYPPHVEDFVYITDNTYRRDELLTMEWSILDTLEYALTQPTARTFIPRLLKGNHTASRLEQSKLVEQVASLCAELAMLDYKTAVSCLPSHVAAASLVVANWVLYPDRAAWTPTLEALSGGYKVSALTECAQSMYTKLRETLVTHRESLPAIREKYTSNKCLNVAMNPDVLRQVEAFGTLPLSLFADVVGSQAAPSDKDGKVIVSLSAPRR